MLASSSPARGRSNNRASRLQPTSPARTLSLSSSAPRSTMSPDSISLSRSRERDGSQARSGSESSSRVRWWLESAELERRTLSGSIGTSRQTDRVPGENIRIRRATSRSPSVGARHSNLASAERLDTRGLNPDAQPEPRVPLHRSREGQLWTSLRTSNGNTITALPRIRRLRNHITGPQRRRARAPPRLRTSDTSPSPSWFSTATNLLNAILRRH